MPPREDGNENRGYDSYRPDYVEDLDRSLRMSLLRRRSGDRTRSKYTTSRRLRRTDAPSVYRPRGRDTTPCRRLPEIRQPAHASEDQALVQDDFVLDFGSPPRPTPDDVEMEGKEEETAGRSEESEGERAARLEGEYGDRVDQLEILLDISREETKSLRKKLEVMQKELDDTRQRLALARNTIETVGNLNGDIATRDGKWGLLEELTSATMELPYRSRGG